jgi:hypothetical protein
MRNRSAAASAPCPLCRAPLRGAQPPAAAVRARVAAWLGAAGVARRAAGAAAECDAWASTAAAAAASDDEVPELRSDSDDDGDDDEAGEAADAERFLISRFGTGMSSFMQLPHARPTILVARLGLRVAALPPLAALMQAGVEGRRRGLLPRFWTAGGAAVPWLAAQEAELRRAVGGTHAEEAPPVAPPRPPQWVDAAAARRGAARAAQRQLRPARAGGARR